jgi:hypothetical protein
MSVAQELRVAAANLEARTAELMTANATIQSLEMAAAMFQEKIAAQNAQLTEQAAVITGHEAAVEDLKAAHVAASAELVACVAALEAENAGMKTKLSNPAFKLAGVDGEDPQTAGGGGEAGSDPGLMAQYAKLTGAAKMDFFRKHKTELLKG